MFCELRISLVHKRIPRKILMEKTDDEKIRNYFFARLRKLGEERHFNVRNEF